MNPIQLAHSPDADDIFMYFAIKFGWVDTKGYTFENIGLDIETLNVEALKGTYDVSAISFGMYPLIKNEYALLRTAVSFGEGYGPKLIRRKDKKLKRNFKVALSGKYTTNAMLFRIYYPEARPVYMDFLEIEDAVVSGKVDAGVLIHESILDFDESLGSGKRDMGHLGRISRRGTSPASWWYGYSKKFTANPRNRHRKYPDRGC